MCGAGDGALGRVSSEEAALSCPFITILPECGEGWVDKSYRSERSSQTLGEAELSDLRPGMAT